MVNVYKYGGIPPRSRPPLSPLSRIVKYGGIPPKPAPPPGFLIPENEEDVTSPLERFPLYQVIIVFIKEFIRLKKRVKALEENQPSIFPIMDGSGNPTEGEVPLQTKADILNEIRALRKDVNGLKDTERRIIKGARMAGS